VWWSPNHPFKSSLTGVSARELAEAYTKATGKQWTQPIGFAHALLEVATDVLKRTADIDDPDSVVKAIRATDLDTIVGKIAWNGKGVPPFAAKNVTKTPLVGGQWRLRGASGNHYDIVITENAIAPMIPTAGKMEPIG
jgi:branched-chain amino acid transport system substrate-binding protein